MKLLEGFTYNDPWPMQLFSFDVSYKYPPALAEAHPGLMLGPLRTVAPPLLDNRSLFIDAQRHSFAGRDLDDFPEIIP